MASHLNLEEQEQIDQVKHFWKKWGDYISTVLFVVCSSFAAYNGYNYWIASKSGQAAGLYDTLQQSIFDKDKQRIEKTFEELKSNFSSTAWAGQAGLLMGKISVDAKDLTAAQDALVWTVEHASDEGVRAIAGLRLAGVLIEKKDFDAALKQLNRPVPPDFDGLFSDRKGDVFLLQDKQQEATDAYQHAYQVLDAKLEYRRLVEIKLNALGVNLNKDKSSQKTDVKEGTS